MRIDYLLHHLELRKLDRREALGFMAKAGVTGALASLGLGQGGAPAQAAPSRCSSQSFDDEMFDVQAVLNGAWDDTAFFQRGDQRGTLQLVTSEKTSEALKILNRGRPVKTYNLGELVFNGFPAFPTTPPRMYNQILTVLGYQPPADFQGVLQSPTPLGDNLLSGHEERFKVTDRSAPFTGTYQIATQLDNLNHIGVGPVFYGGHRGPDLAETWGTSKLGNENMGPIVTRGVLLDVLGAKIAQGAGVIDFATNGRPHLASTYRITVEDLVEAMEMGNIRLIEPGDVVLIRTGWNQLVNPKDPAGPHAPDDPVHPGHPDHVKYLASEPGIFLREARWLACHRPAIVGGDTWGLEVVGNPVSGANAFPVHQELMTFSGIRIGEGIVTDELAADGVFEFVYIVTPQFALGATAGNTPPTALGQPQRPHR